MRKSFFNRVFFVICAAIICCLECGCRPPSSQVVAGSYIRTGGGVTDTLVLYTNGLFDQQVVYTNGSNWSVSGGTWVLADSGLRLEVFYSAFDFEHKTIKIPPDYIGMMPVFLESGTNNTINLRVQDTEPLYMPKGVKKR